MLQIRLMLMIVASTLLLVSFPIIYLLIAIGMAIYGAIGTYHDPKFGRSVNNAIGFGLVGGIFWPIVIVAAVKDLARRNC